MASKSKIISFLVSIDQEGTKWERSPIVERNYGKDGVWVVYGNWIHFIYVQNNEIVQMPMKRIEFSRRASVGISIPVSGIEAIKMCL